VERSPKALRRLKRAFEPPPILARKLRHLGPFAALEVMMITIYIIIIILQPNAQEVQS